MHHPVTYDVVATPIRPTNAWASVKDASILSWPTIMGHLKLMIVIFTVLDTIWLSTEEMADVSDASSGHLRRCNDTDTTNQCLSRVKDASILSWLSSSVNLSFNSSFWCSFGVDPCLHLFTLCLCIWNVSQICLFVSSIQCQNLYWVCICNLSDSTVRYNAMPYFSSYTLHCPNCTSESVVNIDNTYAWTATV